SLRASEIRLRRTVRADFLLRMPPRWSWSFAPHPARDADQIDCLRSALRAAPDYADAMFSLALLLQRGSKHAEAAEYWRRYLAKDGKSEWAARARRSLKFCEMQMHLSAS